MQIILYGVEAFFHTETPYAAPYAAHGGRCQEDDPAFISALKKVPVDTSSALGRVLADAIQAPICLPHWDNASVDGYALRAEDVSQASINTPVSLFLQEEVPAGQTAQKPVEKGTCCRVFTGSPMPPGADAVVMQEDTKVISGGSVLVMECVRPFEYVRFRGEDIQAGKQVIDKGKRLTPFDLGLMSALGITQCQVYEPPKVGVIVTGSECVRQANLCLREKFTNPTACYCSPCSSRLVRTPACFP